MPEGVDNIVLEQLRAIRADNARILEEVRGLRTEIIAIRHHVRGVELVDDQQQTDIASIKVRLERIERRLELAD